MTDAIFYPKELSEVFDRALERCFERLAAGETESIAFLVTMGLDGELMDQRIAVETEDGYMRPLTNRLEAHRDKIKIYAIAFDGLVLRDGDLLICTQI